MKKTVELPLTTVINPIWLSLFLRGVEDPSWGRRHTDQHAIALAIHELAAKISDSEIRKQVQGIVSEHLIRSAEKLKNEG